MPDIKVLIVEPISRHAIRRLWASCRKNGWQCHLLITKSNKLMDEAREFNRTIAFESLNQSSGDLFRLLGDERYDAVVPASEFAVPMSDAIAEKMGLYHNPLDLVSCYRDKSQMRKLFSRYGVSQPSVLFELTNELQMNEVEWDRLPYPVVAKPAEAAGSVLVKICHTADETKSAVREILNFKNSRVTSFSFVGKALVEQAIMGPEFSAEVVINQDKIIHTSVTTKVVSKPPFCDEIGHIVGADLPAHIERQVHHEIDKIKAAYQVRNGVLHAEFKVKDGQIYFIEVAARIAGDMISELVELTYGFSMEEAFILSRAGLPVSAGPASRSQKLHAIRFIFDEGDVGRLSGAEFIVPQDIDYDVKPGEVANNYGFAERKGHAIVAAEKAALGQLYDLIAE